MPVLPASVSAIIQRSLGIAQPIAQAVAEAQMNSTVRIRRPLDNTYDRTGHVFVNPDDPIVYEGKAHISDVSGGQTYNLSGEAVPTTIATCQVPLSASRIFYNDTVEVTASPLPAAQSRLFRVSSVDVGGAIPSQQTLTIEGQAPSKQTPES